jgi:hypothetical protein
LLFKHYPHYSQTSFSSFFSFSNNLAAILVSVQFSLPQQFSPSGIADDAGEGGIGWIIYN